MSQDTEQAVGAQEERTRYSDQKGHPCVRGRCASCGSETLFLGSNGYVTCSVIGCKDPGASHEALMYGKAAVSAMALLRERIEINKLVLRHQHDQAHADWYSRVYQMLQQVGTGNPASQAVASGSVPSEAQKQS